MEYQLKQKISLNKKYCFYLKLFVLFICNFNMHLFLIELHFVKQLVLDQIHVKSPV